MNPDLINAIVEPLQAAVGSMSPQDWLQLGCVALLSWLGGRAIAGSQDDTEDEDEAPRRVSVREATQRAERIRRSR